MPGIISAEIQTETRGSIKRATVRIQANNRAQFDVVDLLYMRLGYTVLLEWGNSSFFDNDGGYERDNPYSLEEDFLNGYYTSGDETPDLTYSNILSIIEQNRLDSNGNYDALFAKVVNFSWKFTKEGKYDITINLISLGDVIESLKSNVLYGGKNEYVTSTLEKIAKTIGAIDKNPIISFRYAHEIGEFFYQIYTKLEAASNSDNAGAVYIPDEVDSYGYAPYYKQLFIGGDSVYYIKLGYFLQWLQDNIIYNIDNDPFRKIIEIDTSVSSNIISIIPNQVSSDLRICTFSNKYNSQTVGFSDQGADPDTVTYFTTIPNSSFTHNYGTDNQYGYLMNAYFSLEYILGEIDNRKDKNGKTSVYDLLTALCDGWNQSTGNYNKLEVTINPETNTVRFTDSVLLPDRDTILKILSDTVLDVDGSIEMAMFDTYRYVSTGTGEETVISAGFIKDLEFTTTVSPELATMITVGSTNQGYVVGEDATALSRMNLGITDRYKETINDPSSAGYEDPNANLTLEERYSEALRAYQTYVREVGYTVYGESEGYKTTRPTAADEDIVRNFKQTQTQLLEYYQAKQVIEKQKAAEKERATNPNSSGLEVASPNAGFLPFNLSLTMDGLSGMKVYQKFTIDSDFLPTNYPRALEFLIKGIKHKIEGNQWITVIDSMCVAKDPFGAKSGTEQASSTGGTNGTGTNNGSTGTSSDTTTSANIPPPASDTPLLTKAVTDQSQYVINTRKEIPGSCANYTYNIAYKIKEHITTNSQQAIEFEGPGTRGPANFPSGGNADSDGHRQAINRLGLYDEYYLGTYTPKQLRQWISEQKFNYGDILNYYAPGYSGEHNMHTQIYTGTIFSKGMDGDGNKNTKPNSGWTTSVKTNYGHSVVYFNDLSFKVYYYQVKPEYQK
jgi:hypothetical protein